MMRFISFTLALLLITSGVRAQEAGQSKDMSLDEAFAALVEYEQGQPQLSLRTIRNACWEAAGSQNGGAELEGRLLSVLESAGATGEAKAFACRLLALVGSERCVPVLASLALDDRLSHTSRSALEAIPNAAAVKALASLAESASGDFAVGIENSLRRRLVEIEQLGQQGGPEAVPFLISLAAADIAEAFEALVRMRAEGVDDAIAAFIARGDEASRMVAIRSLGVRGAADHHSTLESLAKDRRSSPAVRVASLIALADLARPHESDRKIGLYAEALRAAAEPQQKRTVLERLETTPSTRSLELAEQALADPNVARDAAEAVLAIARAVADDEADRDAALDAAMRVREQFIDFPEIRAAAGDTIAFIERNVGFITKWQVAGPFTAASSGATSGGESLFEHAFEPEHSSDEAHWADVQPSNILAPGIVDLMKVLGGSDRVAYLRTTVNSDKERKARLEVGSDDGVKVWLNGELVHANDVLRGLTLNSDVIPVTLKEGRNVIILKITQAGGDWRASARLRAPDGARLEGLPEH